LPQFVPNRSPGLPHRSPPRGSRGSKEQPDGIEHMGKFITRMEQVIQRAAAAQVLNSQSEALCEMVIRLSSVAGNHIVATGTPDPQASLHRVTSQGVEAQASRF
jgi:hypothetical protein